MIKKQEERLVGEMKRRHLGSEEIEARGLQSLHGAGLQLVFILCSVRTYSTPGPEIGAQGIERESMILILHECHAWCQIQS